MRKISKTMVAAVIIVVTVAAFIVGCKKEESTQTKACVAQTEQSMSSEEQKVLDFLADLSSLKQGEKTEGEAVTLEEARWQWETTLNYCHGFPMFNLINLRQDTLFVAMPKTDGDGNVIYEDLLTTYNSIVDAVREKFRSIEMEVKTLQFVMMTINKVPSKNESDSVRIIINSGDRTSDPGNPDPHPYPWYGIPFSESDCYIWEFINEHGIFIYNTAANQLQIHIQEYDDNHAIAFPPYYFIVNPYIFTSYQGGINSDWLFNEDDVTENEAENYFLCYEYLNEEYAQIMQHTHSQYMEIRPYGHDGYFQTMVFGKKRLNNPGFLPELFNISHVVQEWHATILESVNTNYPVPIDE